MLPRGCCCCCRDENERAPRGRFSEERSARDGRGSYLGCADFCGSNRMSEGRQSQVVLLDDRRLDILIKPKLYAGELLDMVASHFSLKEKEYFGLAYIDDTGHFSWLQLDRRVLEHEFPKRSTQSTLVLFFRIKYFVESITHLRDSATVEAFYLQTQALVYNGTIEISSEKAFQLAALVLQATHGDYSSDTLAKQQLKKLPVLPTSALIDHPSLTVCEEGVTEQYISFQGLSRGTAIVNYMRIAESLPTYGVHYYEVKDKAGIPWWLGISYKGICQYDLADRKVPRKLFLWKQLENLYFRDRKFSIEVFDPKRVSASRKTFGSGNISVYVWFASSPSLTKCIWSMAISQHQFYLDRKHNKASASPSRNFNDIADELSHGSYSTETSSLGRSVSSLSLPALKLDTDSCDETLDTVEMFVALKARKEALEKVLHKKCEELKKICLREGELTGALPPEMPLSPGEQIPIIRKKVGGPIKDKLLWKKKTKDQEEIARLELEYEIQTKIVNAAYKLLSDSSIKKNIRRQRKLSHQKAVQKLKEIEQKLTQIRTKEYLLNHSIDDSLIETATTDLKDLSITFSPTESVKEDAKNTFNKMTSSKSSPIPLPSILRANSNSVPSSPSNPRHQQTKQRSSFSDKQIILKPDLTLQGYTPSTVYQTQTSYRSQQYPTFSMKSPSTYSSASSSEFDSTLQAQYRNKFESTLDLDNSNLYSVPTQRTSQAFDTQDDSLAAITTPSRDLGLVSRHNSLDRNKRRSLQMAQRLMANESILNTQQRPSSTQPPAYDNCAAYKTQPPLMFPYPSHISSASYPYHHPHHYHHHRHGETAKSPTNPHEDANLYHQNLKLYASDAIYLGTATHPYKHPSSCDKAQTKKWPEMEHHNRTPFESGLVSPSSGMEKNWPKHNHSVQPSISADSLKSHVAPSLHVPTVDVVTKGYYQPYWEETKPYETSDFYKYSTKHRAQHQAASHNLHAKLLAWKASQTNTQFASVGTTGMSPVLERSRTASPASATSDSILQNDDKSTTSKTKKEDVIPQSNEPKGHRATPDSLNKEFIEWFNKQGKGKKTTLV